MNNWNIAGNIGKDAEIRTTQKGEKFATFSVAIDNGKDKAGNKRDTTWVDCSLWGKRGEGLAPYLTKGTRVAVCGRASARAHEGKAYLQLSVDEITLLGGGAERSTGYQEPAGGLDGDAIPFLYEWRG